MADKSVLATVTGDRPTFINGVLHMPGEVAYVDLAAIGVDKLGKKTPGLVAHKKGDAPAEVEIAAIAPHAPEPARPQGLPPGTVQSGTGQLLVPSSEAEEQPAQTLVAPKPTKK